MFDSIGWGEIIVLGLAALFIFGPERLPHLAKDAAAGLKRVREAITGVRAQVNESLGDDLSEFRDLDLRKYHPKTFIRQPAARRRRSRQGIRRRPRRRAPPRHRPAPAITRRRRRSTPTRPDLSRAPGVLLGSRGSADSGTANNTRKAGRQAPVASASAASFRRARVPTIPSRLRSWNPAHETTASVTRSAREGSKVSVTVVPPSAVGASS